MLVVLIALAIVFVIVVVVVGVIIYSQHRKLMRQNKQKNRNDSSQVNTYAKHIQAMVRSNQDASVKQMQRKR